ncbi:MAG: hypothetical protein ACLQDC_16700 [Verrucomicrobiia bacterium]
MADGRRDQRRTAAGPASTRHDADSGGAGGSAGTHSTTAGTRRGGTGGGWPQRAKVLTRYPSNLKCLCCKHHRLKTFGGWRDQQLADGTGIRLGYPPSNAKSEQV